MTMRSPDLLHDAHEAVTECLVTLLEAATDLVVRADRDQRMKELQALCAALEPLAHAARTLHGLASESGDPPA